MSSWLLADPLRLPREQDAVVRLQQQIGWLSGVAWLLVDRKVCCDATIVAHGHEYAVRVSYPDFFPALPPEVRPLDDATRWSSHQYLNGTLCLEWGPDNWRPELTGADLLASTFKLLDLENPRGDAAVAPRESPSRHELTLGQELRGTLTRSVPSEAWLTRAAQLKVNAHADAEVCWHFGQGTSTLFLLDFKTAEAKWIDPTLPPGLARQNRLRERGVVLKSGRSRDSFDEAPSIELLRAVFHEAELNPWPAVTDTAPKVDVDHALVLDADGGLHHFSVFTYDGRLSVSRVHVVPDDRAHLRLPAEAALLSEKTIAVVGAGSLGSKAAATLVRGGARRMLLVDHDVMQPGNVVRHALDWNAVGMHKARAVADHLELLAPNVVTEAEHLMLAGQESSSAVARIFGKLAQCDLIIDATADPTVFNLLAALAAREQVPMAWGEVYAGGLGGMVARFRPGLDPAPVTMRAAYLAYCQQLDAPVEVVGGTDYAGGGAAPLVAMDADVSVIAHHVARLAMDALVRPDDSEFPRSLYLVGLQRGWIFDEPFQNHFVNVGAADAVNAATPTVQDLSPEEVAHWAALVNAMVERGRRADPAAE